MAENVQHKKIHPYKFTLWVAMASILMMFAGFTSAYIVKRAQPNWVLFDLPGIFSFSTAVILLSSITIQVSLKYFKERQMLRYRVWICVTAVLGKVFIIMQFLGFQQLKSLGLSLDGNVAGSFIYVIAGAHALHVLGGVVALVIMFIKAFFGSSRQYSSVPVEVVTIYWHFIDILWIYLFVFFLMMR
jgi:cytochrome c oxidase subunit 3